jgi:hypothetical protein
LHVQWQPKGTGGEAHEPKKHRNVDLQVSAEIHATIA